MEKTKDAFASFIFRGHLRYFLLKALKKETLHGYAIAKKCFSISNNLWMPSFGSIYPLLKELEKKGLVRSFKKKHGKKMLKLYRLTSAGKKELKNLEKRERLLIKLLRGKREKRFPLLKLMERMDIEKELDMLRNALIKFIDRNNDRKTLSKKKKKLKAIFAKFAKEIENLA